MNNYDHIKLTLRAAEYHFEKALTLIVKDEEYEKVLFHLRAYFWELYSVWDYLMQQANSSTLGWEAHLVKGDFLSKIKAVYPQYSYLKELEEFKDNKSFQKIKKMRNYAHKWHYNPLLLMVTVGDPALAKSAQSITIDNSDKKEPSLPAQVFIEREDLESFQAVVQLLFSKGFFT